MNARTIATITLMICEHLLPSAIRNALILFDDEILITVDYGRLLADRGEFPADIRQLETAIRLQPELWRAHFELAMALGRSGNTGAAREQLTIAANGAGSRGARPSAGCAPETRALNLRT